MKFEITLFILGLGTGAAVSCCFDCLRSLRKVMPHSRMAVNIEDILFWMITTGLLIRLFIGYNHGVIRFYVFLGAAAGSFLYYKLFSRWFLLCLCEIMKIILFCFRKMWKIKGTGQKYVRKMIILPLKNMWERIKILVNNI